MPALIVAAVPPERTGSATSLNQVLRSVGGAVGSTAGAAILTAHTVSGGGSALPREAGRTVAFAVGAATAEDPEVELLTVEEAAPAVGPSLFDGERVRA